MDPSRLSIVRRDANLTHSAASSQDIAVETQQAGEETAEEVSNTQVILASHDQHLVDMTRPLRASMHASQTLKRPWQATVNFWRKSIGILEMGPRVLKQYAASRGTRELSWRVSSD
jgi:hypothetical protein